MSKMVIRDLEKMGRLMDYLEKGKTPEEIRESEEQRYAKEDELIESYIQKKREGRKEEVTYEERESFMDYMRTNAGGLIADMALTNLEDMRNGREITFEKSNLIKNLPANPPLDYKTIKILGDVDPYNLK